ncbi:hypothetical protein ODJ79_45360 [Actinoplanes sp. KI2]|uniref:hypothetical protein n=1 Tax=Actinoplanes sp. KI2 TaxID=2983315 RepID=UPI0021D5E4D1|nr:hypothetical protein [Actinoplanes sp. KI2]MCU7730988.1 hypothetical protein [Actinoplanes sp. KI2]
MNAMSGGKTYSEISGQHIALTPEQKATPESQKLGALRNTLFGTAFATMGTIAGYAAIAAFAGAVIVRSTTRCGGTWHTSRR